MVAERADQGVPLTPDELLRTTRSVRKRLDFGRPVDRAVIEDCLRLAQQAPTGGNEQSWHFVVVTDPGLRRGVGDLYRRAATAVAARGYFDAMQRADDPAHAATQRRVVDSTL
jgi:nitroreductase